MPTLENNATQPGIAAPDGNAAEITHHLAPGGAGTAGGMAGFVLANGSMSSNQSGERAIRRGLIEADWEISSDEMRTTNRVFPTSTFEIHSSNFASLPGQLFYSTQIPVCFWFLAENKNPANNADTIRRALSIPFPTPTRFLNAA